MTIQTIYDRVFWWAWDSNPHAPALTGQGDSEQEALDDLEEQINKLKDEQAHEGTSP